MSEKKITVAVIGAGSRGLDSYSKCMVEDGRFEVVAVCDVRQGRLDLAVKDYGVKKENTFLDEDEFFKEKRADLCIIATQDKQHVGHCIKALEVGYDCLCEKPISPSKKECLKLLKAQQKANKKVVVCHVLRYAPAYVQVGRMIDEGKIGQLVDIHAIEQVTFWHIAHSYVRGNWRNKETTSAMILAKCCHDLDLLQWYAKSKCKTISSIGDLTYFKKENQPKDATDRCKECPHKDTCPYSAEFIYVKRWHQAGEPETQWPQNVVCQDFPLTEEKIRKAYEEHPWYGRCVFACDNNVVDHQETNILFENGVTANLCMTGFTGDHGRIYRFHGTTGEIILDEEKQCIVYKPYSHETQVMPFDQLPDVSGGHGGGDAALVQSLYDMLTNNDAAATTLESSIESHLMSFAAEESRLKNGKMIKVH